MDNPYLVADGESLNAETDIFELVAYYPFAIQHARFQVFGSSCPEIFQGFRKSGFLEFLHKLGFRKLGFRTLGFRELDFHTPGRLYFVGLRTLGIFYPLGFRTLGLLQSNDVAGVDVGVYINVGFNLSILSALKLAWALALASALALA